MRPYSIDLRRRIIAGLDAGQTYAQVAERFNVSIPTVARYRRLAEANDGDKPGSLAPKPIPGRKPAFDADEQAQLRQLLEEKTDWTIKTLRHAWYTATKKWVCGSCLHNWMRRLGFSHKKRV